MKKRSMMTKMGRGLLLGLLLSATPAFAAGNERPVNLLLRNDSSGSVEVEMVDQYGGNVTVTVESGTSQNHTVKLNSAVKVEGNTILRATAKDDGREVVVGR
jgi:hypothetical protein